MPPCTIARLVLPPRPPPSAPKPYSPSFGKHYESALLCGSRFKSLVNQLFLIHPPTCLFYGSSWFLSLPQISKNRAAYRLEMRKPEVKWRMFQEQCRKEQRERERLERKPEIRKEVCTYFLPSTIFTTQKRGHYIHHATRFRFWHDDIGHSSYGREAAIAGVICSGRSSSFR